MKIKDINKNTLKYCVFTTKHSGSVHNSRNVCFCDLVKYYEIFNIANSLRGKKPAPSRMIERRS